MSNAVFTPRELANILKVSEHTIRAMAHRGELDGAFRIGVQWRIPVGVLDKLTTPCDPIPTLVSTIERRSERIPYAGGSMGGNVNRADLRRERKRRKPQYESGSAFAREFPELAARSR